MMSARSRSFTLAAVLGLAGAACGDPDASVAPAASGKPPASASAPAPAPTATGKATAEPPASAYAPPEEPDIPSAPVEPVRKTLRAVADDPALFANRDFVADAYRVVRLPLPLELQEIPLPRGRRALLLTGQGAALDRPLVLVVEADGRLVWSKERPLAGTRERARELTLSRGPDGEVFLFWYDEPTKVLAARAWLSDGSIFADFNVLSSEGCDGVAVLYWPRHGWLAALTDGSTLRAQLLGETGTRKWPEGGIQIRMHSSGGPSAAARPAGRPRIAILEDGKIELGAGARKVNVSPDGTVLPAAAGK